MNSDTGYRAPVARVVAFPVFLAILVGSAVAIAWWTGRRTTRDALPDQHEDCELSECADDGVPLSLYAG